MTVREFVIPFQRNKRSKSVTTAGRPAGRPLILTFLRYIEVETRSALRAPLVTICGLNFKLTDGQL